LFALLIDFSSPQDSDNLVATLRERLSPAERESIYAPKKLHFYLESLLKFLRPNARICTKDFGFRAKKVCEVRNGYKLGGTPR
ncbi:MAG: hypothetical protein IJV34_05840, partial [Prevotella sp.]|nr:hypothetical protein [Prevotella sp.]